jgi:hypothetical protein
MKTLILSLATLALLAFPGNVAQAIPDRPDPGVSAHYANGGGVEHKRRYYYGRPAYRYYGYRPYYGYDGYRPYREFYYRPYVRPYYYDGPGYYFGTGVYRYYPQPYPYYYYY